MPNLRTVSTSIVLFALALSHACADNDPAVRIGLVRNFSNVRQITVMVSSGYSAISTGSGSRLASYTNLEPLAVKADESQLFLSPPKGPPVAGGASFVVKPADPRAVITVDSPGRETKQYRGALEVTLGGGSLRLVNAVHVEDYLPGVLVSEMPASFPDEALQAQAVAARCFTLCSRGKHSSSGYDLCDSAHCQVYDGCMRESPRCSSAVTTTRGQVLTYRNRIASVMYCADCGGVTQCYAETCGSDSFPYLACVTEPSDITHRTWQRAYTLTELAARLAAGGVKEAVGLKTLTVTKTASSGRALAIKITGANGSTTITGARLRSILGLSVIGSCLFTISAGPDGTVTFKGKGFGHGLGMCQVGAAALASPPHNFTYQQILAHYYPGTTLSPAPSGTPKAVVQSNKGQAAAPRVGGSPTLDINLREPGL